MDHVLRYQDTPGIKMIVVLGEVRVTPAMPPVRLFVAASYFHIFSLTLRLGAQMSTKSARASKRE